MCLLSALSTFLVVSDATARTPNVTGWLIVGLTGLIPLAIWYATHHIAPVPRGKVGIIVALASDDDQHDRQVRTDFIASLRKLLERDPDGANFSLVVLPRHVAVELDGAPPQEPLKYLRKLRGHFMLFGRVSKRQLQGQSVHSLTFNGLVVHAPIPLPQSRGIATEFRAAVPARLIIPTDADFFAFEATSKLADLAARYIIGLAALVSNDLLYAERLLLEVERQLKSGMGAHPTLRQVGQQLPQRLKELYARLLDQQVNRYTMTRDVAFLRHGYDAATKLLQRDPRLTAPYLVVAMGEFMLHRDIDAAKQAATKARTVGDATWRYSVAFLTAYEGDLDAADTWYRDAFSGKVKDVTVPVQCEEFIQVILDAEPDKTQLHYCSGLINFHAKKDYEGAVRDFGEFLKLVSPVVFIRQQANAKTLLAKAMAMLPEAPEPEQIAADSDG